MIRTTIVAIVGVAGCLLIQTGIRGADRTPDVTVIPAASVTAAFERGQPMLETDAYKIHASRREAPGVAEIHTRDTDILYVLQGTATIVTGGRAIEVKPTATDEQRGTRIDGGEVRQLRQGDVMVIPNGVPHQFTQTTNPFLYYVVKATAPVAGGSR